MIQGQILWAYDPIIYVKVKVFGPIMIRVNIMTMTLDLSFVMHILFKF